MWVRSLDGVQSSYWANKVVTGCDTQIIKLQIYWVACRFQGDIKVYIRGRERKGVREGGKRDLNDCCARNRSNQGIRRISVWFIFPYFQLLYTAFILSNHSKSTECFFVLLHFILWYKLSSIANILHCNSIDILWAREQQGHQIFLPSKYIFI